MLVFMVCGGLGCFVSGVLADLFGRNLTALLLLLGGNLVGFGLLANDILVFEAYWGMFATCIIGSFVANYCSIYELMSGMPPVLK